MNEPQRVRKMPVEVEAFLYDGSNDTEIIAWAGGDVKTTPDGRMLVVTTLEGELPPVAGPIWIIRGVNGEFYPCACDVFDKTYELV